MNLSSANAFNFAVLDNKILALTELKAFADNKLSVTENIEFVFLRVQNIVGKGKTAGNQQFLLFTQCFL